MNAIVNGVSGLMQWKYHSVHHLPKEPPDLRTRKTYYKFYRAPKRHARPPHKLQPKMTKHLESCVATYRDHTTALELLLCQS